MDRNLYISNSVPFNPVLFCENINGSPSSSHIARDVIKNTVKGFNSAGDFFEGVAVEETFEGDFRPLAEDSRLMPFMLVMILDLYFRLTPITMVAETPEVQELSRLMRVPAKLVVEVLQIYQTLDPYLRRQEVSDSVLLQPCRQIWERYANMETTELAEYAGQLSYYFR